MKVSGRIFTVLINPPRKMYARTLIVNYPIRFSSTRALPGQHQNGASLASISPSTQVSRSGRGRGDNVGIVRGGFFFCFSLTRGRVCGREQKKPKGNTLNTRGCSFGVPLSTRGAALHARHMAKTHRIREDAVLSTTEHERVPYTHATRCTQRYKSTYTH